VLAWLAGNKAEIRVQQFSLTVSSPHVIFSTFSPSPFPCVLAVMLLLGDGGSLLTILGHQRGLVYRGGVAGLQLPSAAGTPAS